MSYDHVLKTKRYNKWDHRDDRLHVYLDVTFKIESFNLNRELIFTWVERWKAETRTFHLPCGECTITLKHVAFRLGLRFPVASVSAKNIDETNRQLLGKIPDKGDMEGAKVNMAWLRKNFEIVPEEPTFYIC
ncbi:hypothetical protein J1N35_036868 [Gossypium stocksii]|uniref:Aminotransferase-like plant mobile domain-containing protein n=1 Tax=Gossypium stocksii TaxID=47602 RepID=A0A9D3ZL57_9ROSI|nr:hypothetical protein J1N35_036868 [Gossypium stocksii]